MKETGRVVGFRDGLVQVEVLRSDQCGRCGRCAHFSFSPDKLVVEARPVGDVKPGDVVEVQLPDRDFLALSFLVYVVPLIGAGAGALIGYGLGLLLGHPSLAAGLGGVLGVVASFGLVAFVDRRSRRRGLFVPIARPVASYFSDDVVDR